MIFTIIAVRKPSLLEQQAGKGESIVAGPAVLPADDRNAAANAEAIVKQPAGLLTIAVREGV